MSNTRRFVLIILGVLLLNGCAQVGVLSGGEQDFFAPAPKRISPDQNTLNFSGNSVEIELNEFVELINPQQNIVMVPAHAKPKVKLTKKTLEITWDETLQPNTTYSIYMNGLVKDITEGNDSLMTYVFSTGNQIDSLYYETLVTNSWTNDPVNKCLVGLYTSSDTVKPLYFSRTDAMGMVRISNIKAGTYSIKAFLDEDKDLKANKTELRGFRSSAVQIDSSFADSLKLQVFEPKEDNILTFKFLAPGAFAVGSTSSLNMAHISLNGQEILGASTRMITDDSLLFFAKLDTLSSLKAIVSRPERIDTLSYFRTKTDKTVKSSLKPSSKGEFYKPNEDLSFELNDQIIGINPSMMKFYNQLDSSEITPKNVTFAQNLLTVEIDRTKLKNVKCYFPKGALRLLNGPDSEETTILVELRDEKAFGTIALNVWESNTPLLIHILFKKEVVATVRANTSDIIKIPFLSPGDYDFRVIEDQNDNGKWDTGDETKLIQPEMVRYFSGPRVRANWEVEVQLDPKDE
jgi:uncharacterized protein (DUF2141 family)